MVYNLPFLLLMPEFKCSLHGTDLVPGSQDHHAYCHQEYICNSGAVQGKPTEQGFMYEVDWSHPHSLYNWIDSFDMLCMSPTDISAMAIYYFLGQTITSLIVPQLQDKYGRKKVFTVCSLINFYCLLVIWGLPEHSEKLNGKQSKLILDIVFFLNGLTTPGRNLTGYTYIIELYPAHSKNIAGTVQQLTEWVIHLVLSYYWMKS